MSLVNDMLKDLDKRDLLKQSARLFSPADLNTKNQEGLKIWFFDHWSLAVFSGLFLLAVVAVISWGNGKKMLFYTALKKETKGLFAKKTPYRSSSKIEKKLLPLTPHEKAIDAYNQALIHINNDQMNGAKQALIKALTHEPTHHEARNMLVDLLLKEKLYSQAIELLNSGLHVSPEYIPFSEQLAHLWVDKKEYQKALNVLNKVQPPLHEYPDYYGFIAALYEQLGLFKGSEHWYRHLIDFNQNNGIWWLGLAVSLEHQKRFLESSQAYQQAKLTKSLSTDLVLYIDKHLKTFMS